MPPRTVACLWRCCRSGLNALVLNEVHPSATCGGGGVVVVVVVVVVV